MNEQIIPQPTRNPMQPPVLNGGLVVGSIMFDLAPMVADPNSASGFRIDARMPETPRLITPTLPKTPQQMNVAELMEEIARLQEIVRLKMRTGSHGHA